MNNYFEKLNAVNVNGHTEERNKLTYLSWVWAVTEMMKQFPDMEYRIIHDETTNLPYFYDHKTGYMVMTEVTIEGVTKRMWLPVMDSNNKAMKDEPYDVKTKYKTIHVNSCTMFDINKSIMRCLTKNFAMFGLGLYIYAGEDLPEVEKEVEKEESQAANTKPATESQMKIVKEKCKTDKQIEWVCQRYGCSSLDGLSMEAASDLIKYLKEVEKNKGKKA